MTKLDGRKLPEFEESRRENDIGNTVIYMEHGLAESRYLFDGDICKPSEGWKQYDTDQDAWYFGVWVQTEARWILTYAEGDLSLVQCPTAESFKAELASMAKFYGDPPPAWTVIDTDAGTLTKYFDERPTGET